LDELRETECLCGPLHVSIFRSSQHRCRGGAPYRLVVDLFRERQEARAQIVERPQFAPADLDRLEQLTRPVRRNTLTRNSPGESVPTFPRVNAPPISFG
jgi:hypothetical protein